MSDFGAVLEGYSIPQPLPTLADGKGGLEEIRPFGETGLTARIFLIQYIWALSKTFRYRQFWRFGHVHLAPVFTTLHSSIEAAWLVEVLRVLDKPKSCGKENLTVRLCHDRFQASQIPQKQKDDEDLAYKYLIDIYDKAYLKKIRDRATFHLDYDEHQKAPRPTGDIRNLTSQLCAWFMLVAPFHYKHRDVGRELSAAGRRGRLVGRHYRRMMMMYYRAELRRPTRRNLKPQNVDIFQCWRRFPDVPNEKEL